MKARSVSGVTPPSSSKRLLRGQRQRDAYVVRAAQAVLAGVFRRQKVPRQPGDVPVELTEQLLAAPAPRAHVGWRQPSPAPDFSQPAQEAERLHVEDPQAPKRSAEPLLVHRSPQLHLLLVGVHEPLHFVANQRNGHNGVNTCHL